MNGSAWQRTCLLCGSVAPTEFAFLPNLTGCQGCEASIEHLQPLGVDSAVWSVDIFQTYAVAPQHMSRVGDNIEDLAFDCQVSHDSFEAASSEFFQLLQSVFGARHHVDIGLPGLRPLHQVEDGAGSGNWLVIDCSRLRLSGTAKDVRTLGIAYSLEGSCIENLVSWTAGNAGQSLLGAASRLREDRMFTRNLAIHLLASAEVEHSILDRLSNQGATIAVTQTFGPLSTRETVEVCGGNAYDGTWLDVTDGWDEAGVLSYRLYAYFLMALFQPKCMIAPVGTGGLFVGLMLGISDYLQKHTNMEATLIGAVPVGPRSTVPPLIKGKEPIAPKLFGPYSPLGLILSALQKGRPIVGKSDRLRVTWDRIGQERQIEGLRHVERNVRTCEPSAAVAIASALSNDGGGQRGLVINTGCGLMGTRELAFVSSYIGPPNGRSHFG